MKKYLLIITCLFIGITCSAQDFSNLYTTYESVYTPPRPVYVTPMPSIYDNSITIIDNSYRPSTPSVRCTDSQKQTGQILMLDTASDKDSVVDAEVLFKTFSDNTASITITRLKLDGRWYPMNIEAVRLSSLLDTDVSNRNTILELMKDFNFFAYSEDVLFFF